MQLTHCPLLENNKWQNKNTKVLIMYLYPAFVIQMNVIIMKIKIHWNETSLKQELFTQLVNTTVLP